MIYDPIFNTPAISFHRLREDAVWLERLLAERDVAILDGTELADALRLAKLLPTLAESPPPDFDPRSMASPLGLIYLSRVLADAKGNPSFANVCRLLPKLAGRAGVPVAQNANRTGERDLVFELEMAAVFASMRAIVESADEPDVVFSYDSATWDVACKLIYSTSPVTLNDRIEEGIAQVLRFQSDYGLVCVGVTNRVNHRQFMPLIGEIGNQYWGVFRSGQDAENAMRHTLRETHETILREKDVRFWQARDSVKFRGIITILHALVGLGSVATILTMTGFLSRADLFDELIVGPEVALTERLNERMQNVLAG